MLNPDEMFEEHQGWLYTTCGVLAYEKHWDRDECLQEGYLGFVDACRLYKDDGRALFTTYARIRVRGAIIDYYRKCRQYGSQKSELSDQDLSEDFDIDIHGHFYTDSIEHPFPELLGKRRVHKRMFEQKYRDILHYYFVEGLQKNEIAEKMGIPKVTLFDWFNKGLQYLKDDYEVETHD